MLYFGQKDWLDRSSSDLSYSYRQNELQISRSGPLNMLWMMHTTNQLTCSVKCAGKLLYFLYSNSFGLAHPITLHIAVNLFSTDPVLYFICIRDFLSFDLELYSANKLHKFWEKIPIFMDWFCDNHKLLIYISIIVKIVIYLRDFENIWNSKCIEAKFWR